ncbi:MAG: sulfite exporter TauE/SafE family protein [Gammaproteobacteria bacterium]
MGSSKTVSFTLSLAVQSPSAVQPFFCPFATCTSLTFNAASGSFQLGDILIDSQIFFTLIPIGALAGFVAGLFGIGGGVVTVVVLVILLPDLGVPPTRVMHVALGTSLAAIVMTSLSSTFSHHRRGAVRWSIVWRLAPATALGAILGGAVAHFIPDRALRIGFGVFLLVVAVRLWRGKSTGQSHPLPGTPLLLGVGGVIGALSSWTGIGGGSLTGPFLMARSVAPREAVATSAAVGFPIAVAGALGYLLGGSGQVGLPDWTFGYVYLPAAVVLGLSAMLIAPLGAKLTHSLPPHYLKMAYASLLGLAAIKVMLG